MPHAKPVVAGLMATRGKQDLSSARSGRASATQEEARGGGWRVAAARFLYPVRRNRPLGIFKQHIEQPLDLCFM